MLLEAFHHLRWLKFRVIEIIQLRDRIETQIFIAVVKRIVRITQQEIFGSMEISVGSAFETSQSQITPSLHNCPQAPKSGTNMMNKP